MYKQNSDLEGGEAEELVDMWENNLIKVEPLKIKPEQKEPEWETDYAHLTIKHHSPSDHRWPTFVAMHNKFNKLMCCACEKDVPPEIVLLAKLTPVYNSIVERSARRDSYFEDLKKRLAQ